MGSIWAARSFRSCSLSFLKSVLQPMSTMGIPRQKWVTSGNHCKERQWPSGLGPDLWPCPQRQADWGDRSHLDEDVVVAGGVHDIIADEHEVGVLVGQGPQPVIIFLP